MENRAPSRLKVGEERESWSLERSRLEGPHWKGRTVRWRSDFLLHLLSAVSTLLTLLPPPVLKCRQFTVAGKHLTVLKGEQIGRLKA